MSLEWTHRLAAVGDLRGDHVVLQPLALDHIDALCEVGLDDELWRWTVSLVRSREDMAAYIGAALQARLEGQAFAYAIRDASTGRLVGSTRFGSMDAANRRVEIGWTWVARARQRSPVNTEAKYLLLRTAFERLGCVRVEFKTDVLNERSRAALRRIGACEEGVLRQHMITAAGRRRDTIYYSILDREWPEVERRLRGMLHGPTPTAR